MKQLKATKTALAKKLGVSRSALYYQPTKPPKDEARKQAIVAVMTDHPAYGHRRIALALQWNHKLVWRIMKQFGLKPRVCRQRRPPDKPEDRHRKETKITNIPRQLCPIRPHVLWAGDFTYFWLAGRFWYLATVIDVYTREIIGWHMANHHTTALIIAAFQVAVKRTGHAPLWFHSDQGSEYVSGPYRLLLVAHGVEPSHSKKGSPWHNGFQESWYSNFKLELGPINRFNTVGELIEAIHQQIYYYNHMRIHTKLKMAPIQFRLTVTAQQKTVALTTA